MGILHILAATFLACASVAGIIIGAVVLVDIITRLLLRLIGDTRRVGSHVGDQPDAAGTAERHTFVQPLGDAHRFAGREIQLFVGFLLHHAGRERQRRLALFARGFHRSHLIRCALELSENGVHFFLGADRRQLFAVFLGKLRLEGFFLVIFQRHFQRPVFLRNKIKDLFFALTDETQRHRLHTPGAEAIFSPCARAAGSACNRQCGRARGAPAAHPHDPYRSRVVP